MSKRDTASEPDSPYVTLGSRVNPTPRDPTSLRPVLEFEFESPLHECGNCRRDIAADEPFRTIAPSKVRYHRGCVSKRAIGSNAQPGAPAQTRLDKNGNSIPW